MIISKQARGRIELRLGLLSESDEHGLPRVAPCMPRRSALQACSVDNQGFLALDGGEV